ncbi:preprotein translocase subunit SecG [Wenyingzhuangia sp. 2_MG-2023]|uniref:preprotein translocase subunit SecG n=1 Tax=Wenyingzhuangia sp. 2_MG-2023 TaxID=3062639 RepID=UPI0026E2BFE7|nr:preprotein translocase subunit SecG [Wenyingzhuangia sp. 2_MG-2023]MDO6737675.1 preprotein translocase subunit SecG [Wenyingzhuangia sp. 2_MG-2023]MDO6802514.1 preprotein translocase subunit SecG [Wenyingzhuangia sp. 1_MG-2023]
MTYNLLLILIMVVAVLLILIVLVQNPKGGGLSSSLTGGSGSTIGGVQSTNNFLDKATWTLAITLLALILLSSLAIPRDQSSQSELQETIQQRNEVAPSEEDAAQIEDIINNTPQEENKKEE